MEEIRRSPFYFFALDQSPNKEFDRTYINDSIGLWSTMTPEAKDPYRYQSELYNRHRSSPACLDWPASFNFKAPMSRAHQTMSDLVGIHTRDLMRTRRYPLFDHMFTMAFVRGQALAGQFRELAINHRYLDLEPCYWPESKHLRPSLQFHKDPLKRKNLTFLIHPEVQPSDLDETSVQYLEVFLSKMVVRSHDGRILVFCLPDQVAKVQFLFETHLCDTDVHIEVVDLTVFLFQLGNTLALISHQAKPAFECIQEARDTLNASIQSLACSEVDGHCTQAHVCGNSPMLILDTLFSRIQSLVDEKARSYFGREA